ncbi:MAG: glutamate racemase [Ruminococcaceae bacterium]|nr:glutamate racemase [Oscillospiraceae bacterium]
MHPNSPIAVIDSGLGGISVLRELVRLMPWEDFRYFGDSANAPYGEKSTAEVRALTLSHAERLFSEGAKALVVACNTATGAAITALRERFDDRVIIGIEPALKPAARSKTSPAVLVMATPLTLKQEKFEHLLAQYNKDARITVLPCHGLVELIEQGVVTGERLTAHLQELFAPLAGETPDAVVLGCTHYPLVREAIQQVIGQNVPLFDGGIGTARETLRRLEEAGLLNGTDRTGTVTFENSADSPTLLALCRDLLEEVAK